MRKRINNIEIHPIIALDDSNNPTTYDKAVAFEQADYDDENIVAWGVFLHRQGEGLENVFDVINEDEALKARILLMELYNLQPTNSPMP